MLSTWYWLERFLDAKDWVVMFLGTQTDTQADLTGGERKYGFAFLKTAVLAGASQFTVTVHDTSLTTGNDQIFKDGDKIRLSDMTTPDAATGNEEFLTISGAPSVSGTDVTITVAETLANGYAAFDPAGPSGGHVISYVDMGDIKCSFDAPVITGSGSWDTGALPPVLDNIGTIEQTITLTFDGAGNFTAASNVAGVSLAAGAVGSDWTPSNPDFAKPYLTIEANSLVGFANGDTLALTTHPASFGIWLRQSIPPACPSLANNKVTSVVAAESAV